MKGKSFKSLLFALVCGLYAFTATATVSLFSDYGQIQNVQNYSSNPFWSPNAPYNQRLPQPVFATGADLTADDCINVVQSLVSVQCMARDNCKNTNLSDIRPAIMVQLSNLPGANYVSSCSGYIDNIFESYKRQYGNSLPNRPTAFPNATEPNPDLNDSGGISFKNPYKSKPTKWQTEQKERADELSALQRQNGAGGEHLSSTQFPATYADLSFSARMEYDTESLMPYKDSRPYRTLNVKTKEEWCVDHPTLPECKEEKEEEDTNNNDQEDDDDDSNGDDDSDDGDEDGEDEDGEEDGEDEDEDTEGLCLISNKFDLALTADTMFKNIQVHTPEVAYRLAQEYVKCSTEPNLTVAKTYTKSGNDDFFNVNKADGATAYKIRFDDVKESNGKMFGMDTIKALCLISHGIVSNRNCSPNSGVCNQDCTNINETQFSEFSRLIQELLGPTGEKFQGSGKWCYKVTFDKSKKQVDFAVHKIDCVSEILIK